MATELADARLDTRVDLVAYGRALDRVFLAINFDPSQHPRDWKGQFKKKLGGMARGEIRELPSGVKIEKKYQGFRVTRPDGTGESVKSQQDAADRAMRYDAKTTHEKSIGGTRSTTLEEAAKQAEGSVDPQDARSAFESLGLQHTHLLDNQLASARRSVLDKVDPPGKPPAKDGTEALKRLKAAGGHGLGRGSSWLPSMDELNVHTAAEVWRAIEKLRG